MARDAGGAVAAATAAGVGNGPLVGVATTVGGVVTGVLPSDVGTVAGGNGCAE
ncbi:MAG TPA: hypothetical protein VKW06_10350 [Candidatus Angelobacter sp.]|nr:hypothetical protein [Candidatus Angelobacter sp.]